MVKMFKENTLSITLKKWYNIKLKKEFIKMFNQKIVNKNVTNHNNVKALITIIIDVI